MSGRKRKRTSRPKKKTTIKCVTCSCTFAEKRAFIFHIQRNKKCRDGNEYNCPFCDFVGYNGHSLDCHKINSIQCFTKYNFMKETQGKLPSDQYIQVIADNSSSSNDHLTLSSAFIVQTIDNNHEQEPVKKRLNIDDTISAVRVHNVTKSNNALNQNNTTHNNSVTTMTASKIHHFQRTIVSMAANKNVICLPAADSSPSNSTNHSNDEIYFETDSSPSNGTNHSNDENFFETEVAGDDTTTDNHQIISEEVQNINSTGNDTRSVVKDQLEIEKRFSNFAINDADKFQLDLYHLLKASNSPMIMYDRFIELIKKHHTALKNTHTDSWQKRKTFIDDISKRLYSNPMFFQPHITQVTLSSSRSTTIVTFSLRDHILKIVTNRNNMNPELLNLDPEAPCKKPVESEFLDELNSGSWHSDTFDLMCKLDNHLLMPFIFFIDGLKVDKYGKVSVEAVLSCCSWFKRKARNRASKWWVPGFVQDQKIFRDQGTYVRDDKAQDYHDMLSHIFKEFKEILDSGGLEIQLNFSTGQSHNVIVLPVIQFIIGDCKGNDLLCGRMGGHNLEMSGLCRDCDIKPGRATDIFLDQPLVCKFYSKKDFVGKSKDDLARMSFLPIRNCFNKLSFGACDRGIYGGTPAEILHAIELGLCEYCADAMDFFFTKGVMETITTVVSGIVCSSSRQSERDLPNLNPFRQGLMSVKSLKARERFSRVYCAFLALSNSHLIRQLCTKKRKKNKADGESTTAPLLSRQFLSDLHNVFGQTICFHEWMKSESFRKSDFEVPHGSHNSRAMTRIKKFLIDFDRTIQRGGNNLKTPKFHQMLHVCDFISRHGSPINCDGSRGENFGKVKIKDNAKKTNMQKDTLNFDISKRIAEEEIMDQAALVYHRNTGRWFSNYCLDTDLAEEISHLQISDNTNRNSTSSVDNDSSIKVGSRPRFKLVSAESNIDTNNIHDENNFMEVIKASVDWGGKTRTPFRDYDTNVIKRICVRLFFGLPSIGGKIKVGQDIPGYTEFTYNEVIYRCHPDFSSKGPWYDWGYFHWEGYDDHIPAQILMVLDLRHVPIIYENNSHPNKTASSSSSSSSNNIVPRTPTMKHLTNDIWAVLRSAESPSINNEKYSEYHFNSDMFHRIEIQDEDNLWFVPLSSIRGPCAVYQNDNYCVTSNGSSKEPPQHCTEGFVMKPKRQWVSCFLSTQED